MRKWRLWTGLAVIVLFLTGTMLGFRAYNEQPFISKGDDIGKQWETKEVNASTIQDVSKSIKDEDIISDIKINQLDKGFNVQVTTSQTLRDKETIRLGKELLNLLFRNQAMNYITLTLYPEGNDEAFVQIRADQSNYLAQDDDLLSGIERLTMINEGG